MSESKVLLVEDSPVVRLTIRQALKSSGVEEAAIFEAGTASEAIELFNQERPEIVFVDINLPMGAPLAQGSESFFAFLASNTNADGGPEAARYMLAKNPALKLVVCTGNPPEDPRVRELVRGGAFDVLQKPVRATVIRELLERMRKDL
ncbi:MAG: response regulator [Thermoplasmata archaeon]